MSKLVTTPGTQIVELENEGEGGLYYRMAMRWADDTKSTQASAHDIKLTRTLRDETGDTTEKSTFAVGALIAIDVALDIPHKMYDLAVEVPLPAGGLLLLSGLMLLAGRSLRP